MAPGGESNAIIASAANNQTNVLNIGRATERETIDCFAAGLTELQQIYSGALRSLERRNLCHPVIASVVTNVACAINDTTLSELRDEKRRK